MIVERSEVRISIKRGILGQDQFEMQGLILSESTIGHRLVAMCVISSYSAICIPCTSDLLRACQGLTPGTELCCKDSPDSEQTRFLSVEKTARFSSATQLRLIVASLTGSVKRNAKSETI